MSKVLKVKCDQSGGNANTSNIRFIVEGPLAPPVQPGQPPVRTATSVVQLTMTGDDKAAFKDFDPGTEYTITIE